MQYFRGAGAKYPNFCIDIKDKCTNASECFTGISGDVWSNLAEVLNLVEFFLPHRFAEIFLNLGTKNLRLGRKI